MSRVRRIRPKKTIPAPKAVKQGAVVNRGATRMRDARLFEKAVQRLRKAGVSRGKLKGTGALVDVDIKISDKTGFVKARDGSLEIVIVAPLTQEEKRELDELAARYQVEVARDALESEGFELEEETEAGVTTVTARAERNGAERTIEVTVEAAQQGTETHEGVVVKIHAVDFDNEEDCAHACDIVSRKLEGEILEDYPTGEFMTPAKRKRETRDGAKDTVLNVEVRKGRREKGKLH